MNCTVFKRVFGFSLCLILLAGFILGCSKGNKIDTPSQSPNNEIEKNLQDKKLEDYSGTVTMWGWDEAAIKKTTPDFNKVFPNIKIEFIPIASSQDYLKKFQTSAAAGMELPDIGWQERYIRGRLFDIDAWEDLESSPYNFDKSQVFEFSLDLVRNSKGKIVGIPWDMSLAGLAYKRDLAKQYFGTDDPAELEKLFGSWEVFISKGIEVNHKSNGKVFMFAGIEDIIIILDGQNQQSFIKDNSANITEAWNSIWDIAVKMRDEGIVDKLTMWSPAWYSSYSQKNHIFFPMAMWTPHYVITPNDPDGKGNWGLMIPPGGGFTWGGTSMGITKNSSNKESAWKFIEWFLLSEEGAKSNKENIGFFTHYKKAYDDSNFSSIADPLFGNQNIGEVWFTRIAPQLKVRPISKYDSHIQEIQTLMAIALMQDKKITKEDILSKMRQELKNKVPEIEVK